MVGGYSARTTGNGYARLGPDRRVARGVDLDSPRRRRQALKHRPGARFPVDPGRGWTAPKEKNVGTSPNVTPDEDRTRTMAPTRGNIGTMMVGRVAGSSASDSNNDQVTVAHIQGDSKCRGTINPCLL